MTLTHGIYLWKINICSGNFTSFVVRFVSAAVYYGVSWAVSDLSGEMYRDYILAMLVEIPALISSVFLMNK